MSRQLLDLLPDNPLPLVILVALIALWFFVFRQKATKLDSKAEFHEVIQGGQPVVLEFFSNL